MITKETTKRAAKILAAQKKEYARSFEAAKGNSKAIAKAAADYRAEYGKTPKKRWANALSQAAKETATHSRPVKKTAAKQAAKPKAATPVAKPAAPKPVVKPASKALPTPKFKLPVYIILTHHYKNQPIEKQDGYIDVYNKRVIVDGKYEYQAVVYYNSGGSHVVSRISEEGLIKGLEDKTLTRLSESQRSQRRNANIEYWAKVKRRQAEESEERARQKKEMEKRDKAEMRELHKVNPEWIKNFAKQAGVSQPVIKALYAIADGVLGKENRNLRPVLTGIYCDPEGYLVATDAHILVAIKTKVPSSLQGKIYLQSGKTVEGKYPSYRTILEHKELLPSGGHRVRPYILIKDKKPAYLQTDNWGNQFFIIDGAKMRNDLYMLILKVFEEMKEVMSMKAYHVDGEKEAKYKKGRFKEYEDVTFDSIKDKMLATLPILYKSNKIEAIQMPLS